MGVLEEVNVGYDLWRAELAVQMRKSKAEHVAGGASSGTVCTILLECKNQPALSPSPFPSLSLFLGGSLTFSSWSQRVTVGQNSACLSVLAATSLATAVPHEPPPTTQTR
eukprot:scaffold4316_cov35-Tisochrysis_lutea.AAC.3